MCRVALDDDAALGALLLPRCRGEHGADGLVEHVLESLLRQSRALEVPVDVQRLARHLNKVRTSQEARAELPRRDVPNSANVPSHGRRLLVGNGAHPPFTKLLDRIPVLAQVELGTDEDQGDVGSVVADLGVPLRW